MNKIFELTKQRRPLSTRIEAILNIFLTSYRLRDKFERVTAEYKISLTQYNILRILKGNYPEGCSRSDIISRLIERNADVTRNVDKLVKLGYVRRNKSHTDHRESISIISNKGLDVLSEIYPRLGAIEDDTMKEFSEKEIQNFVSLIEKIY